MNSTTIRDEAFIFLVCCSMEASVASSGFFCEMVILPLSCHTGTGGCEPDVQYRYVLKLMEAEIKENHSTDTLCVK